MNNKFGTQSRHSMNGTQSRVKNRESATQSNLEMYIAAKTKIATDAGLTYVPLKQESTYSAVTHTHDKTRVKTGTQSFSEKKQFGLIKSLGTHSIFSSEKTNKGITPSHAPIVYTKQVLEFKTQSSVNTGFSMKNNNLGYNNPKLIKGTQSNYTWAANTKTKAIKPLGKNAMAAHAMSGRTQSDIKSGIKVTKFGLKSKELEAKDTMTNSEKKFYAKPNDKTKKMELKPFLEFISKLSDNAEKMIKTQDVTVNGEVVTDINYILKSGDIVRVGIGHYVNNSDKMVIVA